MSAAHLQKPDNAIADPVCRSTHFKQRVDVSEESLLAKRLGKYPSLWGATDATEACRRMLSLSTRDGAYLTDHCWLHGRHVSCHHGRRPIRHDSPPAASAANVPRCCRTALCRGAELGATRETHGEWRRDCGTGDGTEGRTARDGTEGCKTVDTGVGGAIARLIRCLFFRSIDGHLFK